MRRQDRGIKGEFSFLFVVPSPIPHFVIFCLWPDAKRVKLMRYEDPDMGPRKIPVFDQICVGKIDIAADTVFNITDSGITIQQNGASVNVGSQMVYIVQES